MENQRIPNGGRIAEQSEASHNKNDVESQGRERRCARVYTGAHLHLRPARHEEGAIFHGMENQRIPNGGRTTEQSEASHNKNDVESQGRDHGATRDITINAVECPHNN
jgi:hypothetical protein